MQLKHVLISIYQQLVLLSIASVIPQYALLAVNTLLTW